MERIKDHLLLEEEFVQNQERLKPQEEKEQEERTKVDDLRGSPMSVGTLEEIIDDEHAIVSSATGPEYYVPILSFVDKDLLEPGCQVLLHHNGHAVVGVLADDADPMVSVMKVDKAPTESYADVGGLDQQIQEIKVSAMPLPECLTQATDSLAFFPFPTGICRTSTHTSRALRRDGYQAAQGCHSLWSARYRQDATGKGGCKPNVRHVPPNGWI